MKRNRFSDTEKKIKNDDFLKLEESLSKKLPESFISHYLKYNGGIPDKDWVPGRGDFEPTIIQEFFPIYTDGMTDELRSECLLEHYLKMVKMKVVEKDWLPFAVDPGGNFYVLNLNNECIYYIVTEGKGQARLLFDNFSTFLSALTDEDGAFE